MIIYVVEAKLCIYVQVCSRYGYHTYMGVLELNKQADGVTCLKDTATYSQIES